MQNPQYTTGTDAQAAAACQVLRDGIAAIDAILHPSPASLVPRLVDSVRLLTDHLQRYVASAEQSDEEALVTIESADLLLRQAARVLGQPACPQGHAIGQECPECR